MGMASPPLLGDDNGSAGGITIKKFATCVWPAIVIKEDSVSVMKMIVVPFVIQTLNSLLHLSELSKCMVKYVINPTPKL